MFASIPPELGHPELGHPRVEGITEMRSKRKDEGGSEEREEGTNT